MREKLQSLVDFERVNGGDYRISIGTTDIETGELVIFDSAKGDKISVDHLLASCGFLPEFAPVEIGGRLLGDGGLSANAPVDAVLRDEHLPGDMQCFIVDLYAREGCRPESLEGCFARRSDLLFGNQTWQRLESYQREFDLKSKLSRESRTHRLFYLSYRAAPNEAGPEKIFDYSPRSVTQRWRAGGADAELAVKELQRTGSGLTIKVIRRNG